MQHVLRLVSLKTQTAREPAYDVEEEADLFLNGTEFLKYHQLTWNSAWRWPDVPGLGSFKGGLFHKARYEENFVLEGKRVAVIDLGSSVAKIVVLIYKHVLKLP